MGEKVIYTKIGRKIYRCGGLIFPLIYYFHNKKDTLIFISIFLGIGLLLEMMRFIFPSFNRIVCRIFAPVGREYETHCVSGTSYFIVAVWLTIFFFEKSIAITALFFLVFGDTASTLIGERFGKIKIKGKSLEGSFAFFLVCLSVGLILLSTGLSLNIKIIFFGALAATIMELLPIPVNDNLTVALFSGAIMSLVKIV